VVCGVCGQECPAGNRFCGMCGTPLPRRPLGAQGTMNLTPGPLENYPPDGRGLFAPVEFPSVNQPCDVESPAAASATAPAGELCPQAPVLIEASGETSDHPTDFHPDTELTLGDSLQDTVEAPNRSLLTQGEENAATGEGAAIQPDLADFLDALATSPAEPSTHEEAPHFSWMDDVLDQIEREAAKSSEGRDERPGFLDLLGDLSLPRVEPKKPAPTHATESSPETADPSKTAPISKVADAVTKSSSRRRYIWQAIAAVLIFIAPATVQWRSQILRTFQLTYDRVQALITGDELRASSTPTGVSVDSADPNPSGQPIQSDERHKPPDHNPAPNANPEARVAGENRAPKNVTAPANVASPVQSPPPAQDQQAASLQKPVPGSQEVLKAENAGNTSSKSAWLWKATAKGNPDAPVQLAELYVKGDGVPRSCEQALVLLKTAALKDNARACNRLAFLYSVGICVQRNRVQAYRWLHSALIVDPNSQWAQQNRDLIWQQMTPDERTLAQQYR
jgi:hypothetical protein